MSGPGSGFKGAFAFPSINPSNKTVQQQTSAFSSNVNWSKLPRQGQATKATGWGRTVSQTIPQSTGYVSKSATNRTSHTGQYLMAHHLGSQGQQQQTTFSVHPPLQPGQHPSPIGPIHMYTTNLTGPTAGQKRYGAQAIPVQGPTGSWTAQFGTPQGQTKFSAYPQAHPATAFAPIFSSGLGAFQKKYQQQGGRKTRKAKKSKKTRKVNRK
jgi:hypothetical protein